VLAQQEEFFFTCWSSMWLSVQFPLMRLAQQAGIFFPYESMAYVVSVDQWLMVVDVARAPAAAPLRMLRVRHVVFILRDSLLDHDVDHVCLAPWICCDLCCDLHCAGCARVHRR